MNKKRTTLMITSILIMAAIWGFIIIERGTNLFQGFDLLVFSLIVIFGIIAFVNALKKDKDEKEGLPADDELSNQIKYKSGYYAYMASMYMWLFIFLLKDNFPDTETMLGGGILLSALIAFISKMVVKRNFT
jgi:peptidoglycan/LPS O-acetylase OafA/YrhL